MASEALLRSMDLTPNLPNDEPLTYSQRTRKLQSHTAIGLSYQPDKPRGDELWATAQPAASGSAKCNMNICIARLTATVPGA